MLEMFLFFVCGYIFCSIYQSKFRVDLRNPDKLLMWDTNLLAWRPVYDRNKLQPGRKYLFAFEALKEED